MPDFALRLLLRAALGDRGVALCLHRVGGEPWLIDARMAPTTMAADRIDRLIEILLASRPAARTPWLTVTFDDGYDDAASYVASRAPRYPQVEFLFFVCPEKTSRGIGFRWDAVDEAVRRGRSLGDAVDVFRSAPDVLLENEREELRDLGRQPRYRLADVDTLRALARWPNVALGNHTNGHFKQVTLTDEQAGVEYVRSSEEYARLFGPQEHFAFPFGTPVIDVEERHVKLIRALGPLLLWSTESRPYERPERRSGAVLPRFPIDGTRDERQLATEIAARSVSYRLSGRRFATSEHA